MEADTKQSEERGMGSDVGVYKWGEKSHDLSNFGSNESNFNNHSSIQPNMNIAKVSIETVLELLL